MNDLSELTLMGTTVAINDDGLFSLNDLWKASGGEQKTQPKRWLQLKRTKSVIEALESKENKDGNSVLKSNKKAGTFVNRVLVYSYAMHVSAEFEIEVINAFDKQAQAKLRLANLHGKAEWQQNRELGKLTHRKETDVIKTFLAYASAQGSNNYPKHGYSLITKMINSSLSIEDREAINEENLHLLSTAENIAENAITQGMNEGLPYKVIFQQAKSNVVSFAAMAIPFELEA